MSYRPVCITFQPKTAAPVARGMRRVRAIGRGLRMLCMAAVLVIMAPLSIGGGLVGGGAPAYAAGVGAGATPVAVSMDSEIVGVDGAPLQLASFAGQPLLVNFWATWCAPCIEELPSLARAAAALESDGVTVLLVSIDRGGAAKARPFLEQHGAGDLPMGFDPKARLSREMGVRGLPTTFLISADQSRQWAFVGPYEWDAPAVLDDVRSRLQTP